MNLLKDCQLTKFAGTLEDIKCLELRFQINDVMVLELINPSHLVHMRRLRYNDSVGLAKVNELILFKGVGNLVEVLVLDGVRKRVRIVPGERFVKSLIKGKTLSLTTRTYLINTRLQRQKIDRTFRLDTTDPRCVKYTSASGSHWASLILWAIRNVYANTPSGSDRRESSQKQRSVRLLLPVPDRRSDETEGPRARMKTPSH